MHSTNNKLKIKTEQSTVWNSQIILNNGQIHGNWSLFIHHLWTQLLKNLFFLIFFFKQRFELSMGKRTIWKKSSLPGLRWLVSISLFNFFFFIIQSFYYNKTQFLSYRKLLSHFITMCIFFQWAQITEAQLTSKNISVALCADRAQIWFLGFFDQHDIYMINSTGMIGNNSSAIFIDENWKTESHVFKVGICLGWTKG